MIAGSDPWVGDATVPYPAGSTAAAVVGGSRKGATWRLTQAETATADVARGQFVRAAWIRAATTGSRR
jgi:hypothetical protein